MSNGGFKNVKDITKNMHASNHTSFVKAKITRHLQCCWGTLAAILHNTKDFIGAHMKSTLLYNTVSIIRVTSCFYHYGSLNPIHNSGQHKSHLLRDRMSSVPRSGGVLDIF